MKAKRRTLLCEAILEEEGELPQVLQFWQDDEFYEWCAENHPGIYNKFKEEAD